MALVYGPGVSQLFLTGTDDAVREAAYKYTGGANADQQLVTSGTFTVAAVGANQNVTMSSAFFGSLLSVGSLVDILDGGSHEIIGSVVSVSGLVAVIQTVKIVQGAAGNTMATAAAVKNVTSASFVAAAVAANNTVPMTSATQAALFIPGDVVTISDGTTTIVGAVVSQSGASLIVSTTSFSAGSAGSTVAQYATIISTSGDKIAFVQLAQYQTLDGGTLIVDTSVGSMAFGLGYVAQDGTEASHLFDLIASATALATAGRISTNTAIPPPTTDKNSFLVATITGADLPAAANLYAQLRGNYNSTP